VSLEALALPFSSSSPSPLFPSFFSRENGDEGQEERAGRAGGPLASLFPFSSSLFFSSLYVLGKS